MRTVSTGGCYLTPEIAIKLAAGRQDPLTRRERQVAEKLSQGMAVKEIAVEQWRSAAKHRGSLPAIKHAARQLHIIADAELLHQIRAMDMYGFR